jgi:hypothetical protein
MTMPVGSTQPNAAIPPPTRAWSAARWAVVGR